MKICVCQLLARPQEDIALCPVPELKIVHRTSFLAPFFVLLPLVLNLMPLTEPASPVSVSNGG